MRRALAAAALVLALVPALAACPPPIEPDPDPNGPPAPDRFASAECDPATTNPAADVQIGVGYGAFEPASEEVALPIVEVDGAHYAYFSVRVLYMRLSGVCLQYRLDLADPDQPAEAVSFDRFLLDLDVDPEGGGILRGIAAPIEDPVAISHRRALLVVDAGDGLTSGHGESHATFE